MADTKNQENKKTFGTQSTTMAEEKDHFRYYLKDGALVLVARSVVYMSQYFVVKEGWS